MELFSYDVNGEPKISACFGFFLFCPRALARSASLEKSVTY